MLRAILGNQLLGAGFRAVGGDEYKIIKNANFTFSIVSLEIRLRIRLYLFDSSNIALLSLVQVGSG